MSAPAQQAMSPADVKEMKDFPWGGSSKWCNHRGLREAWCCEAAACPNGGHAHATDEHHGGRPVAHQEGYQGIESGRKQGAGPESCWVCQQSCCYLQQHMLLLLCALHVLSHNLGTFWSRHCWEKTPMLWLNRAEQHRLFSGGGHQPRVGWLRWLRWDHHDQEQHWWNSCLGHQQDRADLRWNQKVLACCQGRWNSLRSHLGSFPSKLLRRGASDVLLAKTTT